MSIRSEHSARGQVLILFTLAIVGLLLLVGLVIDGGYAFSQRRESQNAADFAAMAGTRIVSEALTGTPPGAGTAANVEAAIQSILSANGAELDHAEYVTEGGVALGSVVGASIIPAGANGVVVTASTKWRPYFLGIVGMDNWRATSTATAITPGSSTGGGVLPVGINDAVFNNLPGCPIENLTPCVQSLTSGSHNIPGGFGWLAFGIQGNGHKCDWGSSLGMVADGGCQMSQPFLQSEIDGPDSHGCCTAVGLPGSTDLIGTLTGNEWGDLSFYIDNQIPVWVPIWDTAGSNGSHGYYHIVGFGAIVFADSGDGKGSHAKWLTGAAIDDVNCPGVGNARVPGTNYCKAPGGAFTVGVTGAIRLTH